MSNKLKKKKKKVNWSKEKKYREIVEKKLPESVSRVDRRYMPELIVATNDMQDRIREEMNKGYEQERLKERERDQQYLTSYFVHLLINALFVVFDDSEILDKLNQVFDEMKNLAESMKDKAISDDEVKKTAEYIAGKDVTTELITNILFARRNVNDEDFFNYENEQMTLPELMESKGLTIKELADKTGIKTMNITRYMNAACLPKTENFTKIATAMDVTIDTVYDAFNQTLKANYVRDKSIE